MNSPNNFLSNKDVEAIRRLHKSCGERRYADRLKAILLLNSGYSYKEISEILIVDDDTIRCWYHIFQTDGYEALMYDLYKGGTSKLDATQLKELDEFVDKNLCLTAKFVCTFVMEKWGIEYTERGMADLLHSLGFSFKKPTLIPGNPPSKEKQKEFASKIVGIIQNKAPEDKVYFADACHAMLNPIAGYGWIRTGEKKEIKTNSGRERLNINGAYNFEDKEAITLISDTVNAQSTIQMLDLIQEKQPEGNIILFADNARYYKCKLVFAYLALNTRIQIIHIPPYCPNLNLIERLWRFYKKKLLYQKYYPKLKMMEEATLEFFDNLKNYASDLGKLITLNFEFIGKEVPETTFP